MCKVQAYGALAYTCTAKQVGKRTRVGYYCTPASTCTVPGCTVCWHTLVYRRAVVAYSQYGTPVLRGPVYRGVHAYPCTAKQCRGV
jgi:hypothetical protein